MDDGCRWFSVPDKWRSDSNAISQSLTQTRQVRLFKAMALHQSRLYIGCAAASRLRAAEMSGRCGVAI